MCIQLSTNIPLPGVRMYPGLIAKVVIATNQAIWYQSYRKQDTYIHDPMKLLTPPCQPLSNLWIGPLNSSAAPQHAHVALNPPTVMLMAHDLAHTLVLRV